MKLFSITTLTLITTLAAPAAAQPIELTPAEVEVEASARAEPVESALATGANTVIDVEKTVAPGVTTPQILQQVPGVQLRSSGTGGFSTIAIRGLGAEHVTFVLNDLPMQSAILGPLDLTLLPVESLSTVTVYRGFGPVRFQQGLGGVLHITTRAPSDTLHWGAQMGFGSQLSRQAALHLAGPLYKNLRAVMFVGYAGTQGNYRYYNDNGTYYNDVDNRYDQRSNNASDALTLHTALETSGPAASTLKLASSVSLRKQGVPGPGNKHTRETSSAERNITVRMSANDITTLGGHLRTGVGADMLHARRHFRDPNKELGYIGNVGATLYQWGLDARMQYLWSSTQETEISPRLTSDFFHQALEPSLDGVIQYKRLQGSVGIEHRMDIAERLRIVPAMRIDAVHDTRHAEWSPRLGAIVFVDPCEIRANAGRFHRFPTLLERYGDGVGVAQNLSLQPESGFSADAGMSCKIKHIDASVFGYHTRAKNLLMLWPSSRYTLRAENLLKSRITGVESSVRVYYPWAEAALTYTLTHAINDTPYAAGERGRRLVGVTPHRALLSLGAGPAWLRLRYQISWASQMNLMQTHVIPARILHDAFVEMTLKEHLSLHASVRNVTNKMHEKIGVAGTPSGWVDTQLVDYVGYPLPGRTFFASLIWRQ